jgi:hypothetical protein
MYGNVVRQEAEMQSEKQYHTDDHSDFPSRILRTIGIDMKAQRPTAERLSRKTPPLSAIHAGELRSATFEPDCSSTSASCQTRGEKWHKSAAPVPRPWNETLAFATDG